MILDDHHNEGKPCRVFCTQPRRISALSVADRVAAERGEKVGQTVGYQIRLESRVSPKTLLTFCTNGVLLRTLMGADAALSTVTHVIVVRLDFGDWLLTVLVLKPEYPLQTWPIQWLLMTWRPVTRTSAVMVWAILYIYDKQVLFLHKERFEIPVSSRVFIVTLGRPNIRLFFPCILPRMRGNPKFDPSH